MSTSTQVSPDVLRWRIGPLTPTIELVRDRIVELMDGPGERGGIYCEPLVYGECCEQAVELVSTATGVAEELVWAAYGRRLG